MLRLSPSELTLTAEDIEETFTRIARRQALRNAANAPAHGPIRNGRPTLRRGPQRAVQDAVTTLGDIPILSPQPHQAIQISEQDHVQAHSNIRTPSPQRRIPTQAASAATRTASHILQLPFRRGSSRRDSHTTSEEQAAEPTASQNGPSETPERDPADVPQPSSHRKKPSVSHTKRSISNAAELRGGGRNKRKGRSGSRSSIRDPEPPKDNPPEDHTIEVEPGMLILHGRFVDSNNPRHLPYVFDEFRVPQTEPRHQRRRDGLHLRSLSSGNAPWTYETAMHARTTSETLSSSVFNSLGTLVPPSQGDSQLRQRQRSTETSSNSAAYSFYELPPNSMNSSNSQPASLQPAYDGTAAPSNVVRGFASPQVSAITAIAQGQPSPLEPYSEYFQEANTSRGHTRIQPFSSQPGGWGLDIHHILPTSAPIRDAVFSTVHHTGRPSAALPNSASRPSTPRLRSPYESEIFARRQHTTATRETQRSSENAPVSSAGHDNRPTQHGQVQTHRAAYERLSHAQQALGEVAHRSAPRPVPHDASNRSRTNAMTTGSSTRGQHLQDQHHLPRSPPVLDALSMPETEPPARIQHSPATHSHQPPVQPIVATLSHPRIRNQRPSNSTIGPSARLYPPGAQPSTFLTREPAFLPIRGTFSPTHRPMVARTHRRVPPEQRNQENSGAAEDGMMRLEDAAFRARYTDESQEVMDETPPPVGRVERRMGE